MTEMVFDIETDGLWPNYTKVHCISIMALEGSKNAIESFSDTMIPEVQGTIQDGLKRLSEASTLICHNQLNFDLPCLKELYDWTPSKDTKIFDTLVVSRLLNPDRPKPIGVACKGGPHSLEAWGCRTGTAKPVHETWDVFDAAMLRRNRQDVEINASVYTFLKLEMQGWDWSEALEIEHKVAEIITRQERNGVHFNVDYARQCVNELDLRIQSIDDQLIPNLPQFVEQVGASIQKPFKTNSDYTKRTSDWYPDLPSSGAGYVGGPFSKLNYRKLDLGSIQQVKEYLFTQGWEPTEWNYNDDGERTSPKLTEDSYPSIKGNIGKLISDRLHYSHRRAQILGWISRIRNDGRLSAGANTCGTPTGRMRHQNVVNVPKAVDTVFYGKEMRSMFTASPGRVMVGHDAEGLELRMLAHYMGDKKFTESIISGDKKLGTDVHTINRDLAGLNTRDQAKTFIYALIYGAGDGKLGAITGGDAKSGRQLKNSFFRNLPALKRLIDRVSKATSKGFLKGLDGRKLYLREKHKALNTLIQGAGAIVMKKSMIILDEMVKEEKLDVLKVIDMHDEAQADVTPEHTERYAELARLSIVKAGEHFKLKCPLAADSSVGENWAMTH
jgi:DNA polymerase I-like protein with 3'-5' exonuclease and polymerase domains